MLIKKKTTKKLCFRFGTVLGNPNNFYKINVVGQSQSNDKNEMMNSKFILPPGGGGKLPTSAPIAICSNTYTAPGQKQKIRTRKKVLALSVMFAYMLQLC